MTPAGVLTDEQYSEILTKLAEMGNDELKGFIVISVDMKTAFIDISTTMGREQAKFYIGQANKIVNLYQPENLKKE